MKHKVDLPITAIQMLLGTRDGYLDTAWGSTRAVTSENNGSMTGPKNDFLTTTRVRSQLAANGSYHEHIKNGIPNLNQEGLESIIKLTNHSAPQMVLSI